MNCLSSILPIFVIFAILNCSIAKRLQQREPKLAALT